jgi:hypothetical protein
MQFFAIFGFGGTPPDNYRNTSTPQTIGKKRKTHHLFAVPFGKIRTGLHRYLNRWWSLSVLLYTDHTISTRGCYNFTTLSVTWHSYETLCENAIFHLYLTHDEICSKNLNSDIPVCRLLSMFHARPTCRLYSRPFVPFASADDASPTKSYRNLFRGPRRRVVPPGSPAPSYGGGTWVSVHTTGCCFW